MQSPVIDMHLCNTYRSPVMCEVVNTLFQTENKLPDNAGTRYLKQVLLLVELSTPSGLCLI
jgi:hypothetical protein